MARHWIWGKLLEDFGQIHNQKTKKGNQARMAGGRQDIYDAGQAGETNGDVRALPQQLCKQTLCEWKDGTADYVRTKLFHKQQFVSDEDLVMGGHIQKLVSKELHISGIERQRLFWEEQGGMTTVRNTVRKKRQAAQNAMKLAFRGK
jgi:hypothetical protein